MSATVDDCVAKPLQEIMLQPKSIFIEDASK